MKSTKNGRHTIVKAYRYLIHLDNLDKFQYDKNDVFGTADSSAEFVNSARSNKCLLNMEDGLELIVNYILDNGIIDKGMVINFCIDNHLINCYSSRTYFFNNLIN